MAVETSNSQVGPRLKALRTQHGLSLKQLAEHTSLSQSFLSMVETGQCDITLGRLMRLVSFYRISIADVVGESDEGDDRVVVRKGEGKRIHSAAEGVDFHVLAPAIPRSMSACLIEYEPGAGMISPDSHPGEEWAYILEGEVELLREGRDPLVLQAGDTAYFPGTEPHRYRNVGDGCARVLGVVTPARF